MKKKKLTIAEEHQRKIAISTLMMNNVGASIMGGMTKAAARTFLTKIGFSDKRIRNIENPNE